jgi:hypothetical protein
MSSCWPTSRIFEDVANFDEGGIRSCVEHVDDAGRATMAGALMNAVAIKALVQRVFRLYALTRGWWGRIDATG